MTYNYRGTEADTHGLHDISERPPRKNRCKAENDFLQGTSSKNTNEARQKTRICKYINQIYVEDLNIQKQMVKVLLKIAFKLSIISIKMALYISNK